MLRIMLIKYCRAVLILQSDLLANIFVAAIS